MIKNITYIVLIPYIIISVNDFDAEGFIVVGIYLFFYFAFFHPEKKENKILSKPIVNIKDETTTITPKIVTPPSKYRMSQFEFEEEINNQLNKIRGTFTRILWVGDQHRTHPWSLKPGGCTLVVLFNNKICFGYDKVKRPDRYTKKITREFIINYYSNKHTVSLEDYINEIYLTRDSGIELKKVWHSNMQENPWLILEKYRTM